MTSGRRSARERPEAFGAFAVSADVGSSPSGSAYLALDPATNTRVLLLTIDPVKGRRKDTATTGALQAWCASAVPRSSVPRPVAAGVEAGVPYVVYPFLPGITLADLMQQNGPQPLAEVVRTLTPLAAAIDEGAAAGMHHGALTPADIFVTDETVNVTRFGLVEALSQGGLTVPVHPPYASPERVAGEPPTTAADVYSLAAIALLMIGGAAPELRSGRRGASSGDTQLALPLSASEEETIRAVVGVDARLLRTVMSRALSEDSAERPPSASELVDGLRNAMVMQEPAAPLAPINEIAVTAPVRRTHRNLVPAVVTIVAAAALVTGAFLLWGGREDSGEPTPAVVDTPDAAPAPPAALTVSPQPAPSTAPPKGQLEVKPPAPAPTRPRPATADRRSTRAQQAATRAERQSRRQRNAAPAPPIDPNAPGALFVTSEPPGAQLLVDGEPVGTTPLLLSNVSVGAHQVRVELSGFQTFSSSVQIEPGKRARVTAKLTP